ncbi:MAG TPA: DUF1549 domain-containing protein [Planctomycetaceae bacterium]|nr:DUF1549 domain-containing protein [Planctomycetaceae bacterium]
MIRRTSLLTMALMLSATLAWAADITPSAADRFSDPKVEEVPQFRKHVVPILSRLGCNGRACHGSFQGQGGFRLSLFGYDFKMDHEGLSERIDLDAPADSYALQKALTIEPHEGGKRFTTDDWEYRIVLNWIKGRAKPFDAASQPDFVRLHVEPKEIVFHSESETAQLKVLVEWSDGSMEDVTKISRYRSNDESVAAIDRDGLVSVSGKGDTHVVVFYDNGVVPIPVIRPVTDLVGSNYPEIKTNTQVDELVVTKLSKLGIVPSGLCTDSEFLRRISLDLTGTLPTSRELKEFLADSSSDKRAKKIEELLDRPGYAAWWTTKLCDYTGNNDTQLVNVLPERSAASKNWYDWIHARVEKNVPYDQIMAGIVTGTSRQEGESFKEFCENLNQIQQDDSLTFADRETMPFFWARRNVRQNEEKALSFAYSFMGIRIQCAQCHKHPFDQWTQDDYNQFTNFFTRIQFGTRDRGEFNALEEEVLADSKLSEKELKDNGQKRRELYNQARKGKAIPLQEVYVRELPANARSNSNRNRNARNNNRTFPLTAKLLGDEEVNLGDTPDPRAALMEWLRSEDNPYFAKAFVNRVWASYFNVGIVEPPDDLNLANPPSNAALLDYLASGFQNSGFDMKWLHREICNSDTYQRSWSPNDTNALDERNFSRSVPRRLPAEVVLDALKQATLNDERSLAMVTDVEDRAIARISTRNNSYALGVFGSSTRESNCDCDRSMEASLLQTIYLRNDRETQSLLQDRNSWVAQVMAEISPQSRQNSRNPEGNENRRLAELKKQYESGSERLEAMKKRKPDNPRIKQDERKLAQLEKQIAAENKRLGLDKPKAEEPNQTVEKPEYDAEEIVQRAYLRTLTRFPTAEELDSASEYLASSDDLRSGLEGLLWALLNTKEFIVNH